MNNRLPVITLEKIIEKDDLACYFIKRCPKTVFFLLNIIGFNWDSCQSFPLCFIKLFGMKKGKQTHVSFILTNFPPYSTRTVD